MARIPDKQAVFLELDGVLCERPSLNIDGEVSYYPDALDALRAEISRQCRARVGIRTAS